MGTEKNVAMVLSIIAMLITITSFQAKEKRLLLILQTVGTALYLISYLFSEGGIAVALNIVYLVRNILFILLSDGKDRRLYVTAAILCVTYIVIYIVYAAFVADAFAIKLWYLLPVAGALFGTCGVVCKEVNFLRAWKMGDSLCWLAYNIHIGFGALGGIIGEILNLLSQTVGILRFRKGNQSKSPISQNQNDEENHNADS
jgi:membrane protein